jgi:hypothetical protein
LPFTNAGAFTRIVLPAAAAATFIAFQTCIQSCSCPTPFLSLSRQTWQWVTMSLQYVITQTGTQA